MAAILTPRERDVAGQLGVGERDDRDVRARGHGVGTRQDRYTHAAGHEAPDAPAFVGLEPDPGLEPGVAAGPHEQLAQPRALAVADELLVLEIGHPELAAP